MLSPWADTFQHSSSVFLLPVAEAAYKGGQLSCSRTGKMLERKLCAGQEGMDTQNSMLNVSGWSVLMITSVA